MMFIIFSNCAGTVVKNITVFLKALRLLLDPIVNYRFSYAYGQCFGSLPYSMNLDLDPDSFDDLDPDPGFLVSEPFLILYE
jgi:hypothetical protein